VYSLKILTPDQMKEAENRVTFEAGISTQRLMENAGAAAARVIREEIDIIGIKCSVICGKGNNGGDGFVVARKLVEYGADVTVVLASEKPKTTDAFEMLERLNILNIKILEIPIAYNSILDLIKRSTVIVDAIFGIGFNGAVNHIHSKLINAINLSDATVFSLDVPSGVNALTGQVDSICVKADYTIVLAVPKPCHVTYPSASFCGKLITTDIGIPEYIINSIDSFTELINYDMIKAALPERKPDSHKGNYGRLLSICGSVGMTGAAYFAATAAIKCGAGLVTAAVPKSISIPLASKFNEVMLLPLEETSDGTLSLMCKAKLLNKISESDAVVLGCGLGSGLDVLELVAEVIKKSCCPIILDADGINAINKNINLLQEAQAPIIMTPHPGELARLLNISSQKVQADRINIAQKFAISFGVVVVLKGIFTIIAKPNGHILINPTGNPGMAKGGSGDVLSGMIASFVAQGLSPVDAAMCGVFLHGLAGDTCAHRISQYGMTPTDMLDVIPHLFKDYQC
jgi:hydroxyethylthiazole kinase-like uncharacterized protein yjeF